MSESPDVVDFSYVADSVTRWSPLEIGIILHYYSHCEDHPAINQEFYRQTAENLAVIGLIEERPKDGTQAGLNFGGTEMGRAFITLILSTELPQKTWVDKVGNRINT